MKFHVHATVAVLLSIQVHLSLQGNRASHRIVIHAGLASLHDLVGFKLPIHVAPDTSQQARVLPVPPPPPRAQKPLIIPRQPSTGRIPSRGGRRPVRPPKQSRLQVILPAAIRAEIPHHVVHEPHFVHLDQHHHSHHHGHHSHIEAAPIIQDHGHGIELVRVATAPHVHPVYRHVPRPDKTIIITLTDGGAHDLVAVSPAAIPAVKPLDVAADDSDEDNC